MTKRVFAVRLGEFVEFRSANLPPRARVSKLTLTVFKTEEYLDSSFNFRTRKIPVQKTLKQTFYVGGRVIGTCKGYVYRIYMPKKFHFGRRHLVEVTRELKDLCMKGTDV